MPRPDGPAPIIRTSVSIDIVSRRVLKMRMFEMMREYKGRSKPNL
jgi:hypothetical protein